MKLIKISVLITLTTTNVEKPFSVFSVFRFLTKLQNAFAANSLDKLMQLISMEAHMYDLDMAK